jgi:hypothetical protein
MRARSVVLAAALATVACGPSIESATFRPAPQPTRMEDVRVFSASTPECAWEELGIVAGPKTDLFTSLQRVVDGMRRRAAELGGDAMVNFRPVDAQSSGGLTPGGSSQGGGGYVATVVRFTEPCPGT